MGRFSAAGRSLGVAGPLVGLVLLTACGPARQHYVAVETSLAQARFAEADKVVEANAKRYGSKSELLYLLDRAMTLHYAGQYQESNRFLDQAERLVDELFTKSVTAEASAMLSNDFRLPYEGEDFETVLINVVGALNYALMDQWEDALVEARRVDHKLNVINDRYDKKNVYREDAFARYLSGILYEARGELNDAFIAYRKAHETYRTYQEQYRTPPPPSLPSDLLRVTQALGLQEEHAHYREQFPTATWTPYREFRTQSHLIVISYDGLAPVKVSEFVDAPVPDGSGGFYIMRVAFPKFVPRSTGLSGADVRVANETGPVASQRTFMAEDVTAIALKDLADRIGRISAKAIARATAKYAATRAAKHEVKKKQGETSGALIGLLGNIYGLVTEQADTRSWRTLPGAIRMARIDIPPGTYTVEVVPSGSGVTPVPPRQVTLGPGRTLFLADRLVGPITAR